jgi:hypothetical protein
MTKPLCPIGAGGRRRSFICKVYPLEEVVALLDEYMSYKEGERKPIRKEEFK